MCCRASPIARAVFSNSTCCCAGRHQPEQIARLLPVVVVGVMVVVGRLAFDGQRRLGEVGLVVPQPGAVRVEAGRAAEIAVDAHLAVAVIAHERAFRRVDRDLVEVDAEPVALRVAIGEQARLQHLVRREADAGDDVRRRERRLLDFGEIVVRLAVELHHADLDQRILGLRPDLGQVERVVPVRLRLRFGHHLDEQRPAREVAGFDRAEEVAAVALAVLGDESLGFRVGQVLNALLRAEVEFDPDALIRRR